MEKAVAEIIAQAGRQFDPRVVDAFSQLDHPTLLHPLESDPHADGQVARSQVRRAAHS